MNDRKILEAFLNQYSDLYKSFKESYLKEKEKMEKARQEHKEILNNLKQEYTQYYDLIDKDISSNLQLPPPNILNCNGMFLQGYVIDFLKNILTKHECIPITFNQANEIPESTDTTYWAYNPARHHIHWRALVNQLLNNETAWKWFQENYVVGPANLYNNSKHFKEDEFYGWFIGFFHHIMLILRSFQV